MKGSYLLGILPVTFCTFPYSLSHGVYTELHPTSLFLKSAWTWLRSWPVWLLPLLSWRSLPRVLKETEFNIPSSSYCSNIILKLLCLKVHSDNVHCDDPPRHPKLGRLQFSIDSFLNGDGNSSLVTVGNARALKVPVIIRPLSPDLNAFIDAWHAFGCHLCWFHRLACPQSWH